MSPSTNGTPGRALQPGAVRTRLDTLEEDVGDAEQEIESIRADILHIKRALYIIAGAAVGDLVGISTLIESLM